MIVEHVWNLSFDTSTNIVDVYINYLRKKVDGGTVPHLIHTVRGVGYELSCPAEATGVMAAAERIAERELKLNGTLVSEVFHNLSQPLTALHCELELALRARPNGGGVARAACKPRWKMPSGCGSALCWCVR